MDKVVVKSQYNKKYHYKFYTFHLFRKSFSIYVFALAAILSIVLAIQNTMTEDISSSNLAISWGFAVLIVFSIPSFTIGRIRGIIKRSEKDRQDNYEIIELTRFKITRFIENVEGKAILGWENFESIYEFKDYYLIYIDKEVGLFIVKEDIVEGSVEVLNKLITNNMTPNKKGKVKFKKMYKDK